MKSENSLSHFRIFLIVSVGLTFGTVYQFTNQFNALGVSFSVTTPVWFVTTLIALFGCGEIVLLGLTWTRLAARFLTVNKSIENFVRRYKKIATIIGYLILGTYPLIILGPTGEYFTSLISRVWVFLLLAYGVAVLFQSNQPSRGFYVYLVYSTLLLAAFYKLATYIPEVNAYPFSLGWSETSRYYYASLFFSEKLYGFEISPTVLHPSRYLLQSLPFLFSGITLWGHRFWQVLLWIGFTTWSSVLLAIRAVPRDRFKQLLVILGSFLFFLVGPVYYHLQVVVIIVLWGYDTQKIGKSLLVVLIASIWAGISRVNWYPVPAMLAVAIYLIEKPKHNETLIKYLFPPALWGILGTLIAFGAQTIYVLWSGNDPGEFTSSFTSDLLWNRLLPNATYPLGILPGILVIAIPAFIYLGSFIISYKNRIHWSRWVGIGTLLLVLLAGGLVVSVKIGGGSNLHNYDAFLVLVLVVCLYLFFGHINSETPFLENEPKIKGWPIWVLLGCTAIFTLMTGQAYQPPDLGFAEKKFDNLTARVTEIVTDGGEVLFITQRHLVTFDLIPAVPLIPEYENVFFMEMVMGNNQIYLDQFYSDLQDHRFDLIVSSRMARNLKDSSASFAEENNVWVERVTLPLLEEYQSVEIYKQLGIELFSPQP
jgi:hypothetical protein